MAARRSSTSAVQSKRCRPNPRPGTSWSNVSPGGPQRRSTPPPRRRASERYSSCTQSSPCPCRACTAASRKRVTQLPNLLLFRPWNCPGPRAQASAELVRPLVRHLEDEAPSLSPHQNLTLSSEPPTLREPDRLAATVLEELGASAFHGVSLDSALYKLKQRSPARARRWRTPSRCAGTPTCRSSSIGSASRPPGAEATLSAMPSGAPCACCVSQR